MFTQLSPHKTLNLCKLLSSLLICFFLGALWLAVPHPLVIVVVGLLPLALITVLKLPFLVCLGFILFSFFRIHEAFPFLMPFKIPLMLALASLTALAWHFVFTKSIKPYTCNELNWFLGFFAIVTIGLVFSTNRGLAIGAYTGSYVKIAIMVFAIAWLVRTRQEFAMTNVMIVVCGILIGIVALQNKANGIGLVEGTRVTIGRDFGSILGDPNDLALVLSFPVSFAAGMALTKGLNRWMRILGVIGFFVIAAAIIATQSRGGLLAILAVSGVFALAKIKSRLLVIGMGGVAGLALLAMAGISGRSSGGAAEEGIDASAAGRLYAWEAAFNMANTHPLTGVGLDNFTVSYFFYSNHWDGMNHAVHSTWFGVLAETGYIGLIVFITLVVKTVSSIRRLVKQLEIKYQKNLCPPVLFCSAQSILAGLAGFCVSGTFLTQGFTWPIYILLALSVAIKTATASIVSDCKMQSGSSHSQNAVGIGEKY